MVVGRHITDFVLQISNSGIFSPKWFRLGKYWEFLSDLSHIAFDHVECNLVTLASANIQWWVMGCDQHAEGNSASVSVVVQKTWMFIV